MKQHFKKYALIYVIIIVLLIVTIYNRKSIMDYIKSMSSNKTQFLLNRKCTCPDGSVHPSKPPGPACDKACAGGI